MVVLLLVKKTRRRVTEFVTSSLADRSSSRTSTVRSHKEQQLKIFLIYQPQPIRSSHWTFTKSSLSTKTDFTILVVINWLTYTFESDRNELHSQHFSDSDRLHFATIFSPFRPFPSQPHNTEGYSEERKCTHSCLQMNFFYVMTLSIQFFNIN